MLRNDGPWLAGFHFNNALARLAALFERLLKIAAGRRSRGEKQKQVLADALVRYRNWSGVAWTYKHINAIYEDVNDLKHDPVGLYPGRKVEFDHAVLAVDELLTLLEAWNRAGRREKGPFRRMRAARVSPLTHNLTHWRMDAGRKCWTPVD